jgi:hypothetical protein
LTALLATMPNALFRIHMDSAPEREDFVKCHFALARSRARVDVAVSGPRVPEFAGVRQDRERVAESVVARPADAYRLGVVPTWRLNTRLRCAWS